MARPLRLEFEGALYHLTGRGNARQRIFADEADCVRFAELLRDSLRRYDIALHAYVLMGNHYHFLAETRQINLSRWMHWLMTAYTVYFNRRHRLTGHLFQGRYKSIIVQAEGYLLSLSRYLHLNPVRGRVIGRGDPLQRRQRLRDWRWSSYRGYSGLARPEPWINQDLVLAEMDGPRQGQRMRYRRFVEDGLLREIDNPLEAVKWQAALGTEDFLRRLSDRVESHRTKHHREVPSLRKLRPQVEPEAIFAAVAKAYGCSRAELLAKVRGNEARAVAMVLVWDCCGLSLQEIVGLFQATGYTAASQMIRRTREKDQGNFLQFKLAKLMGECVK